MKSQAAKKSERSNPSTFQFYDNESFLSIDTNEFQLKSQRFFRQNLQNFAESNPVHSVNPVKMTRRSSRLGVFRLRVLLSKLADLEG